MDDAEKLKQRLKAASLAGIYGYAIYQAGSDLNKAEKINEFFDGRAAMMVGASNATGTVAYVDLTPHTSVDKQYFNLEADYALNHDIEEQT